MERLFFDGAMGTYLRERFGEASAELCCRQNPGAVEAVHRAYIEAGATALKTNSFGEHALEIHVHATSGRPCLCGMGPEELEVVRSILTSLTDDARIDCAEGRIRNILLTKEL